MRISRKGIIHDIWQIIEDSFDSQTFHLTPGMCFYLYKEKTVVIKNPQEAREALSKNRDYFLILPVETRELSMFDTIIHGDISKDERSKLCTEIDKRIQDSLNRIQLS